MKYKLGFVNYWGSISSLKNYFVEWYILPLFESGIDVEMIPYDPTQTECDIVFYSVFGSSDRIKKCKGSPIFIAYSGEKHTKFYDLTEHLSLSFRKDSPTDVYFPLWQIKYEDYKEHSEPKTYPKKKFCTFIVSNPLCSFRNEVFKALNEYRKVDSCGRHLNNMDKSFRLPNDMYESVKFHRDYKFNLCFENAKSLEGTNYITEKLMNAYTYGTVPIYWGDDEVEKWFNPKSFINCNGKSIEEIVELVKYYDTHDKEYYEMLNEKPFNEDIDWVLYAKKRYVKFVTDLLKKYER